MTSSNNTTGGLLTSDAEEAYARYGSAVETGSLMEYHSQVLSKKPDWAAFTSTRSNASLLKLIDAPPIESASKTKCVMLGSMEIFDVCMAVFQAPEVEPVQWMLALFYELLREDSSSYQIFENGLKRVKFYEPLMAILTRQPVPEQYLADKASWLLSTVICHCPSFFTEQQVSAFLKACLDGPAKACSQLGELDMITNLLKSDAFRRVVFGFPGVHTRIFDVEKTAASPILYKVVFAIWMLSFDKDLAAQLKAARVVKLLKEVLCSSRAEKVVRVGLTATKNLLGNEALCEDIVEENMHDVVSCLEFEKWRDGELYDEIRDVTALIGQQVHTFSNIDRYERELATGRLSWGHMHTSKFWIDNAMLFERNDFSAIRQLSDLLLDLRTDPLTLAVACHDLGEFVALHPSGKSLVARLTVKQRVMQLMGHTEAEFREVRREALLCCQKITLNRWQDTEKAAVAK